MGLRRRGLATVALVSLLVACSNNASTQIRVSAASSLRHAFDALEVAFEDQNPGVDLVLNLAGTATLREQILEGAPVDVFASADIESMTAVADVGLTAGEPRVFARNTMAIAVPLGNPGGVSGLEDLERDELAVGLCAAPVPCGALARDVLANGGVEASIDTNELNVTSLLTKIESGDLDAGIVYTTDVVGAEGAVESLAIPEDWNVVSKLPIAALHGADAVAADFVSFVLSSEGRTIMAEYGFESP